MLYSNVLSHKYCTFTENVQGLSLVYNPQWLISFTVYISKSATKNKLRYEGEALFFTTNAHKS